MVIKDFPVLCARGGWSWAPLGNVAIGGDDGGGVETLGRRLSSACESSMATLNQAVRLLRWI